MPTQDEINAAIMTVAKAHVAEALGQDIIAKVVKEVANRREGYGGKTLLDQIVTDGVQRAIERAVMEHLAEHMDQIHAAMREQLAASIDRFAVDMLAQIKAGDWRTGITIKREG